MILKIRNGINNNDYRLIDNIAEINYAIKPMNKAEEYYKKYQNESFRYFCNDYRVRSADEPVLCIFITFRDHTGMVLLTDTSIYILDDSGQTIEKVQCVEVCNKTEDFYKEARKHSGCDCTEVKGVE
jgi:hypothetical protein